MLMTDQELKDEMRQDMRDEARQEAEHERWMRDDYNYALNQVDCMFELYNAIEAIKVSVVTLNEYGYDVTVEDLLNL